MSTEHVRVRVGEESYALPVESVLEVGAIGAPTPVPGAPRGVLGIWNLRGQVLPVLELAALLGIEAPGTPARMIVAEAGDRRAALAVDAITEVGPLPAATEPSSKEHLTAAALIDGELVGVVEVESLLGRIGGTGRG
jgi:chemotaxis signal transduction protein